MKSGTDYVCYQTILRKNTKNNAKEEIRACTSRVKIGKHGECKSKTIPHSIHANHELIFKDFKSKNNIIDDVVTLSKQLKNLSTQVSTLDVFTRELAT